MSIISFVDNNKTKVLGALTVALGFVQAYPALPDLLSPTAYGWTMMVVGALVAVCGFLNTHNQGGGNA